jgi:hypothetical protein
LTVSPPPPGERARTVGQLERCSMHVCMACTAVRAAHAHTIPRRGGPTAPPASPVIIIHLVS